MTNENLTHTLRPRSWRTAAMHDRYEHERQADLKHADFCPLCDSQTIRAFTHWRIIPNKYPYDAVAVKHDQLVPTEHLVGADISEGAWQELDELKTGTLNDEYSFVLEALPKAKSIPGHFHLHLIEPKQVG